MQICVLGINFKTAPVEIREKINIPAHQTIRFLKELEKRSIFDERLILSTCNRTEIYGVETRGTQSLSRAKEFLRQYADLELMYLEERFYSLLQPHSIQHLFSVASGLDSMVIGETEITGQVKEAYLLAQNQKQTGKVLNHLFQKSFKVAKDLRTKTNIGAGRVSVGSVAVDLAEKIFENLNQKQVMVIGTGLMSTQVLKAMISKGALAHIVSSRHSERAIELAKELGAVATPFEHFEEEMLKMDILITATQAPYRLIKKESVEEWMKKRGGRPLFLIDIAVPRNMDDQINKIESVYLYDVDDLQAIADQNRILRETELEKCLNLVGEETQYFMGWLSKEFGVKV